MKPKYTRYKRRDVMGREVVVRRRNGQDYIEIQDDDARKLITSGQLKLTGLDRFLNSGIGKTWSLG